MKSTSRARVFEVGELKFAVLSRPSRPRISTELTPTETEIVELLARGFDNAAIAEHRGTSARTVSNQLQRIYKKLGVAGRAQLRATLEWADEPATEGLR